MNFTIEQKKQYLSEEIVRFKQAIINAEQAIDELNARRIKGMGTGIDYMSLHVGDKVFEMPKHCVVTALCGLIEVSAQYVELFESDRAKL